jgi:PTH2 family peptidyl-tRNA hydrolase
MDALQRAHPLSILGTGFVIGLAGAGAMLSFYTGAWQVPVHAPPPALAAPAPAAAPLSACLSLEELEDDSDLPDDVELKMVICVRSDLAMSKGKTAAQVAHGALGAWLEAQRAPQAVAPVVYAACTAASAALALPAAAAASALEVSLQNACMWRSWAQAWHYRAAAKITLKVDDEAMFDRVADAAVAAGLPSIVIEDAGRTEIPSGSRTVVAIGPAPKAIIDLITGPRGRYPLRLLT